MELGSPMNSLSTLTEGFSGTVITASITALTLLPAVISFLISYYIEEEKGEKLSTNDLKPLRWIIRIVGVATFSISLSLIITLFAEIGAENIFDQTVSGLGWGIFFMVLGVLLTAGATVGVVIFIHKWWFP